MKNSTPKGPNRAAIALLALLSAVLSATLWLFHDDSTGQEGLSGGAREQAQATGDERYAGTMPSELEGSTPGAREAVVTPLFAVVLDAFDDKPVPFLDLVVVHRPDWNENLPALDAERLDLLAGDRSGGDRTEYEVQTDKYGRFEVPLRGRKGHIALNAFDGPERRRVPLADGFSLWLEELPLDFGVQGKPLEFTAAIGPTIALNLTPPGQLKISYVLESIKLSATGEGPKFLTYLDMRGDTRRGVDWYRVRYDVHPALHRIYLDAYTDQGFPERVSHTAAWIRLPEVPPVERAPGGQDITLHVQDEEGLLAGSGVVPILHGIQADALGLELTKRGVIAGKVVNQLGLGVPGQRMHLRSLELNEFPFVRGRGELLVTNEAGEFRLECVSEGSWQLQAWNGGNRDGELVGGQGVPLLMELAPQIGAIKNVMLTYGQPPENRSEIRLTLSSYRDPGSKKRRRQSWAEFESIEQLYGLVGAVLVPLDSGIAEVVPTIPVGSEITKRSGSEVEVTLTYPSLPPGNYDLLLGDEPSPDSEFSFVWQEDIVAWSPGGEDLELQGNAIDRQSGRPWSDPLTGEPAALSFRTFAWAHRDGLIGAWGFDGLPDAEPELIVLEGNKVTSTRLAGQRMIAFGERLTPVLEPKPRPTSDELQVVQPMSANAGWGIVLYVSLGTLGAPLPGARVMVDGAFATRTDGEGRALLAAPIPPSRVTVSYPGYHMLNVPTDENFLPIEALPMGQIAYRVLMLRD